MNFYLLALLAGVCFGAYPFLLRWSNLNGFVSAAIFTLIVAVFLIPTGVWEYWQKPVQSPNWKMLCYAGVLSSIGMLAFVSYLSRAPQDKVGYIIVTMVVIQMIVTTLCQSRMNQQPLTEMPLTKAIGIGLAIVAIILIKI